MHVVCSGEVLTGGVRVWMMWGKRGGVDGHAKTRDRWQGRNPPGQSATKPVSSPARAHSLPWTRERGLAAPFFRFATGS